MLDKNKFKINIFKADYRYIPAIQYLSNVIYEQKTITKFIKKFLHILEISQRVIIIILFLFKVLTHVQNVSLAFIINNLYLKKNLFLNHHFFITVKLIGK
jgi:hypothetical protein